MGEGIRRARSTAALVAAASAALPASAGVDNDSCATCAVIDSIPFVVDFDNASAAPSAPAGSCNAAGATTVQNDAWWCFTPPADCVLTLLVDYSPAGPGYDGMTVVYEGGDCGSLAEIECLNETFGGQDSDTATFAASAGVTYFVQIGDWGTTGTGGPTRLELDCRGAAGTGACCFDSVCEELDGFDCVAMGGDFLGDGSICAQNPCPQPPANDLCGQAIEVGPLPALLVAETCLAADDDSGECFVTPPNQGVWYRVQGTGGTIIASTCHPGTDFDTKLQVFCNSCTSPVCVAGEDDPPGDLPECEKDGEVRLARVEWCSVEGAEYLIAVGGFGMDCGTVELSVESGGACADPVPCLALLGRCCFGECTEDINADGQVTVDDLITVILSWGACPDGCPADLDGDLVVGVDDLIAVILAWGPCESTCGDFTEAQCGEAGGVWQSGLDCSSPCPIAPPNDDCLVCSEIDLDALPFIEEVDTSLALQGAPRGSCNAPSAMLMQNDVWWCMTPTSPCLVSISVQPSYDAIVAVYRGPTCAMLEEITCINEPDDPAVAIVALEPGFTYFVQVGDWGNIGGGGSTVIGVDCLPDGAGACCLPGGGCQIEVEAACAKAGGAFQGPLTTCDDACGAATP